MTVKIFPLAVGFLLITGCKDIPSVNTNTITDVQYTSATGGGKVTDDGNADVSARGVCWSTDQSPTTADSKTLDGAGIGSFTSSLTSLNPNTLYYVKAYAINSEGTAYGNEVSFTTSAFFLPSVTTTAVTSITANSAVSGGNVTSDGGANVTSRGVCWNTSPNPTTANSKTSNGNGLGSFTSSLTGLQAGTLYYLRAYAVNSVGTAYGNEVQFTTLSVPPKVHHQGIVKTNINVRGSSVVLGQITINPTSSGKVIVSFDGLCYSTPGDRIILAASNTTSWGINDGSVGVEAFDSDINENPFSHTRVYNVSPGSQTFYAVAQNYVETAGDGIVSIYGSLTVQFVSSSNSLVGFSGIIKTNLNLTNETTVGTVTINPTVSGKAIVKFDGQCISSPGDRIVLAASNTSSWGTDDGSVSVEAVNSDINTKSFCHTRVYDVSPGSRTFYAVAQNYVETAGDGIASIYGSLTVHFVPASVSIVGFTGIKRTSVNLSTRTILGQVTINPTVSGKVLVRFDGNCISSPGDGIVLAASNTTSWGVNDGNLYLEAIDTDLNSNSFSHTRVYSVSPGSRTFYAIGHNYVEVDGNGIASIYGSLTVKFFPD